MKLDPRLQNDLNQEPWYQSGVAWFGAGGVLWALGFMFDQAATCRIDIVCYDMKTSVLAVGTLVSAVGVLVRRFVPGLNPMFDGWFGK